MQPLLFLLLSPFILATSAQKLRQRQGLDGGGQSFHAPLQYSLPPAVTLALSTPAAGNVATPLSTALPKNSDNVNLSGGSAHPSLTGVWFFWTTCCGGFALGCASFVVWLDLLSGLCHELT